MFEVVIKEGKYTIHGDTSGYSKDKIGRKKRIRIDENEKVLEYRVGKNEENEDFSLGSEEDIGILGIYLVNKKFLDQLETLCKAKDVYMVEKFM